MLTLTYIKQTWMILLLPFSKEVWRKCQMRGEFDAIYTSEGERKGTGKSFWHGGGEKGNERCSWKLPLKGHGRTQGRKRRRQLFLEDLEHWIRQSLAKFSWSHSEWSCACWNFFPPFSSFILFCSSPEDLLFFLSCQSFRIRSNPLPPIKQRAVGRTQRTLSSFLPQTLHVAISERATRKVCFPLPRHWKELWAGLLYPRQSRQVMERWQLLLLLLTGRLVCQGHVLTPSHS